MGKVTVLILISLAQVYAEDVLVLLEERASNNPASLYDDFDATTLVKGGAPAGPKIGQVSKLIPLAPNQKTAPREKKHGKTFWRDHQVQGRRRQELAEESSSPSI